MAATTWRRVTILLTLSCAGFSSLRAQDRPKVELPAVRFELAVDGELTARIGDDKTLHPLIGTAAPLRSLGSGGILATFFSGDLLSKCDAPDLFERLGRGADTDLLRAIGRKPEPGDAAHEGMLRILAVRAVQLRGLKPALGVLQRVLEEPEPDQELLAACSEAIAALKGEPAPSLAAIRAPLISMLATVPIGADIVLSIDVARMPRGTGVLRLPRILAQAQMDRVREHLDADAIASEWFVSGLVSSVGSGAAGYCFARQLGNLRVDRIVVAVNVGADFNEQPEVFVTAEGSWSRARIAASLRDLGVTVEEAGDAIVVDIGDGQKLRVRDGSLAVDKDGFREPRGEEAARDLAAALDGEAQIALWWDAKAPYPEEIERFRITRGALTVPLSMDEHLRLTTQWLTPATASAVAGLAGGLGRLLETMTDDKDELVPLTEAAAEMKVVRDGVRVDFDAPLPQADLLQLAQELFVRGYSGGK
ncbi:MAG: hypothetical protein HZB39_15160 [Planctomycetes bacterium]|nr:hypothetical protein [Planctomycetota bacterium]